MYQLYAGSFDPFIILWGILRILSRDKSPLCYIYVAMIAHSLKFTFEELGFVSSDSARMDLYIELPIAVIDSMIHPWYVVVKDLLGHFVHTEEVF